MKTKPTIPALLCAAALAAGLLSGCTQSSAAAAPSGGSSPAGQSTTVDTTSLTSEKVKAEDLDATWDAATATKIALNGATATVDGAGAAAEGGTVTISAAGTYVASGDLTEGQIVVNAPEGALVRLVMNGASIHNSIGAAINCQQADKLVVILADGTANTLSDGDTYTFPDGTDEPSATLFSKADLTINGSGALTVNAAYNNGIGTKDDLIIVSGDITVDAANHAIRGRDSVTVLDGALTLTAGGDGIQANNDTAEDKGWVELYGGTYAITCAHDGVQAETTLTVYGGEFDIVAGGGSANAPARAEESMGPGGMGNRGSFTPPDATASATPADTSAAENTAQPLAADTSESTATTDTTTDATSDSYKGLKAVTTLTIAGGTFTVDSADDGVHSNGDVLISGGNLTIATGDDGVHADATLTVEGEPAIDITQSYEGLEGADVIIKGGVIDIVASDDGINAAGGSDANTTGGNFGPDSFAAGDYLIRIEGGTIGITAGADGLDSNGDIEVAGGTTTINMTNYQMTGGGDGAIDRDGNMSVTGGTIMAASGTGIVTMGQASTEGTTQSTLSVNYTTTQAAGTTVELKDDSGNIVASFTPTNSFNCVVFTTPGMADGGTYTLTTGGQETLTATLSGAVTSLTDTGEAYSGGMGGGRGSMGQMPSDMSGMPDMGQFPGTPPDRQA